MVADIAPDFDRIDDLGRRDRSRQQDLHARVLDGAGADGRGDRARARLLTPGLAIRAVP